MNDTTKSLRKVSGDSQVIVETKTFHTWEHSRLHDWRCKSQANYNAKQKLPKFIAKRGRATAKIKAAAQLLSPNDNLSYTPPMLCTAIHKYSPGRPWNMLLRLQIVGSRARAAAKHINQARRCAFSTFLQIMINSTKPAAMHAYIKISNALCSHKPSCSSAQKAIFLST